VRRTFSRIADREIGRRLCRAKIYEAIVKGERDRAGRARSFNVLVRKLRIAVSGRGINEKRKNRMEKAPRLAASAQPGFAESPGGRHSVAHRRSGGKRGGGRPESPDRGDTWNSAQSR